MVLICAYSRGKKQERVEARDPLADGLACLCLMSIYSLERGDFKLSQINP